MATVVAVCTSQKKGTKKKEVDEGFLQVNFGLVGDAHADSGTHRQVSLLAVKSIDKMRDLGLDVKPGDFGENLTTEDIDLVSLPIGSRIAIGDQSILEITQIGKECHDRCAIYHQVGKCVMPEEGVFTRVIKGGPVKAGDRIKVV